MSELPNPQVIEREETQSAPEPSLREQLKTAYQEATKPTETVEKTETPEAAEAEGTQRDEQGRFVAKPAEAKRETLTLPKKEGEAQQPQPAAVKPPDGWNAAAKAKFATLEPDIQSEILRREREAHQKITSQDTDRDFGSRVRKLAEPYTAIIQAEGGTHEAAFRDYLNTAYILRSGTPQQKLLALQTIAQRFNVPLAPLQQQGQPNAPAQLTPAEARRIAQEEIQNQRQTWEEASLKTEIDSFAESAGHEHFETVKPIMSALLQSGKAATLQDAYDQAIWADPEIRSTLTASQTQAAQAQQRSRTDAAKRAAVSVTGGPGGAKPANANTDRSLRDELRANFAAATGRV